jgi:hypothetical protein
MKRHVSAYLGAIFRFTNAGYIETNNALSGWMLRSHHPLCTMLQVENIYICAEKYKGL